MLPISSRFPRIKAQFRDSRAWTSHVLEPLEIRALLSAAIQVSGNGVAIANGDKTPSTADFTDFRFMSTTADAALGTSHRSFTITDTGDADLLLTGVPAVTISGPNSADFTVATQPATTISPGSASASTFTINFVPHGKGNRTAKVTIKTNDPANKTFTFTIKGLGVATINNSSNHLQFATTTSLNTHINNSLTTVSHVFVDDLGFLTDGTVVFDSDQQDFPTAQALDLEVANGTITGTILNAGTGATLITGLITALQGVQIGQTRSVVVPADLGYGSNPADQPAGVPPNSTILFTMTVRPPTLAVFGTPDFPVRIFSGDTTPTDADSTNLGTIPAGDTTSQLASTFELNNIGNGNLNLTGRNPITITGKDARQFNLAALGTNSSFSGFIVQYRPTTPGVHTATVHVKSTDPVHPDFTYVVKGTLIAFNDLAVSTGNVNFPASGSVTAGAATKFKFPIVVTNQGNVTVPGNAAQLDVQIFAHNRNTDELTQLTDPALTSTIFRGLGVNKSRTLTLSLAIPQGLAASDYDFVVRVDNTNVLNEISTLNNSATGSQHITVV